MDCRETMMRADEASSASPHDVSTSRTSEDDDDFGEQFRFMAQTARKHQRGHSSDLYVQGITQDSKFATFRQRCVEWVYGVAHAINLDKHGAWCAIAIMDKYLSTTAEASAASSEAEFRLHTKLKCLCAMMISSKVNGYGHKMSPAVAAHLSAGLFSVQQVLQHEREVMGVLSWDVNFISPYEAIHFLVPHIVPSAHVAVVAEVAEKMIDGARSAPSMIGVSAAVSACAAVHIALQHCEVVPRWQRCRLHLAVIAVSAGISTGEMQACAAQLDPLGQAAGMAIEATVHDVVPLHPRVTKSPTSVTRKFTNLELSSGTIDVGNQKRVREELGSDSMEDDRAPQKHPRRSRRGSLQAQVPPAAANQAVATQ
jgi:hypothetical protein